MSSRVTASIIIPMFRAEDRISAAIESIIAQGRSDIEIICVDDASPDNQVAVVEGLQQTYPYIRLLRNTRNMGPGGSTNAGIDAATGDYLVIVHSDDVLLPGALDALIDHVGHHPSDLVLLGCEEHRRGTIRPLTDEILTRALESHLTPLTAELDPRVLLWPPGPWSKAYRREFLNQHNLRFPEGVFEDIPWSIHTTVLAEAISVLPGPIYRYVTADTDSSITTTLTERNLDRLTQVRLVRDDLDLSSLSEEVLHYVSAVVAIHLIWANRSAYKTLPPHTHEKFFLDSAAEMAWWQKVAAVPRGLSTQPLMANTERNIFTDALLQGSWHGWQRTLRNYGRAKRFRRFFRPGKK